MENIEKIQKLEIIIFKLVRDKDLSEEEKEIVERLVEEKLSDFI